MPSSSTTTAAVVDVPMAGVADESSVATKPTDGADGEQPLDLNEQRIRLLPGATETAASFEFDAEDHTLGNALRYIINKNPDVELCGYSIPHPAEAKMNLRIQTYNGVSAHDVLEKGLDDLMDLCDVVEDKFTVARDEFMQNI